MAEFDHGNLVDWFVFNSSDDFVMPRYRPANDVSGEIEEVQEAFHSHIRVSAV